MSSSRLGEGLTPEQLFVIECIRTALGSEGAEPGRTEPLLDWQRAYDLAIRHGVAPLVHSGLQQSSISSPDEFRTRLRATHAAARIWVEFSLEPALRLVLDTLEREGVDYIILKGTALAYTAYADASHRSLADIDLLVDVDQVTRASAALLVAGFWVDDADLQPRHHLRGHYDPAGRIAVELHHQLIDSPNPYEIGLDGLWARSRLCNVAGTESRVLSLEDALHLACVHLSYTHRYRWFPLRGLTDLLAITTCGEQLDWTGFIETVERSRTKGAVYWPLCLSRTLLKAAIPEQVLSRLSPSTATRRLMEPLMEPHNILDERPAVGNEDLVLYDLLVGQSLYGGCALRDQAAALLKCAFPPAEAVGHLSPGIARSKARYIAHFGNPKRVAHGVAAFGRLVANLRGPNPDSHSA